MASLRTYLEDTFGDNIRFVYRHFPLSFHTKATITAEAAEAAGAQGKFFEMHDLLYARQQEWGALSDADMEARLIAYAAELGLDTERFAEELRDHTYLPRVQEQLQQAIDARLSGTPSYIVNGVEYPINEIGLGPQQVVAFIRLLDLVPQQYTELPPVVTKPDKKYVATIETSKGRVVVELFSDQAPVNANNFAFLAEEGWYDGQAFFYVDPASAAYAGDPTNMGWGLPYVGYICGDEIRAGLTFDQPGMVAFYTPAPGRNSNLFFITTVARPDFNGKFTIIGRVVEGLDVVKSLTATRPGGPAPDTIKTIRIEERS
jgi:cyclophilin family peptidyl-prolyl cis-trans isomerase